nr:MAG TPA: hypothetical protein [Caudoviricetes sp.]DAX87304.1 MAG TPA: hypothetical protein [Caudoviricetes sp.]
MLDSAPFWFIIFLSFTFLRINLRLKNDQHKWSWDFK